MAIETLKESLCVNQIIGKAKDNQKDYKPVMEELFIFEEEIEYEFSILETKFENEFRPNERLFTSKEIIKYGIKDYNHKKIILNQIII